MLQVQEKAGSVFFSIKAQPRSSKSMVTGAYDGSIKVNLKAPPVDGEANLECCRLLARTLGVARSSVEIVSGTRGKMKRVKVFGLSAVEFTEKITPYLYSSP
ncbi:MAG: hypothetical protein C1941_02115 [Prosthecochloris sp.]|nr:hypothetical protein [Prosthecochloris sp.]